MGARRGGVKHRKNSPQVTVFSQSGEVAMLRAGRWLRRGNLPEGKCRKTNTRQPARPRWLTAERKRTEWRMRGINLIKMQRRFPLIRLAFATFRQSTFPRGGRLNRLRTPMSFRALVEKSPAAETARYVPAPAHLPAVAHRRASLPARGGSPSRNLLRQKREQSYTRQPNARTGSVPRQLARPRRLALPDPSSAATRHLPPR